MKNLTTEQKQMEREYSRMQSVIDHATRGQQLMRPINGEYSEFQRAAYATYQAHIDAAQCRMRQLEQDAKGLITRSVAATQTEAQNTVADSPERRAIKYAANCTIGMEG